MVTTQNGLAGDMRANTMIRFALLAALGSTTIARTAPEPVRTTPPARAVASLKELPPEVIDLLRRDSPGGAGIADAGENFNAGDAIVDAAMPRARFVAAMAAVDWASVTVERGGRGRLIQTLTFTHSNQEWKLVARTHGYRGEK